MKKSIYNQFVKDMFNPEELRDIFDYMADWDAYFERQSVIDLSDAWCKKNKYSYALSEQLAKKFEKHENMEKFDEIYTQANLEDWD
jgi:hypothetical protein